MMAIFIVSAPSSFLSFKARLEGLFIDLQYFRHYVRRRMPGGKFAENPHFCSLTRQHNKSLYSKHIKVKSVGPKNRWILTNICGKPGKPSDQSAEEISS
jgi:hypothetical protein